VAEFFTQFGIDWRLLISQAVNFTLVLVILRMFVYKPVANILHERRRRVELGIVKAEEADRRLQDAQDMAREQMKDTQTRATALLREVEEKAKEREAILLESSRRKGEVLLQEVGRSIEAERVRARADFEREAKNLVRAAVVRVAEMDADKFDDSLLEKALTGLSKKHS